MSLDDAVQQYFFISGKVNAVILPMGNISASECPVALAAIQTFIDDMKATQWPASASAQLAELISANEYDLFVQDAKCRYPDQATADAARIRETNAVFAWRQAIGAPTDF